MIRAALFFTAVLLADAAWQHKDRLRHLAVPVLEKPVELPAAPVSPLAESPGCEVSRVASVGNRVTALLTTVGGVRWVGTFDHGVYRDGESLSGQGRQRFVNALVEHEGAIYAATYGGVLEYRADGALVAVHLPGVATEALLVHGGRLYEGTVQGVFVDHALAEGKKLRVNALTASGGDIWVGTPSGVYTLGGAWYPLVFGPEASLTNVVLGLAPSQRGVVALTDNGGLVEVERGSEVRALRFSEPRANEGNPGAVLISGGVTLFGTQGGGLLQLAGGRVSRPRSWPISSVSALADGLAGDANGDVWAFRCPPAQVPEI